MSFLFVSGAALALVAASVYFAPKIRAFLSKQKASAKADLAALAKKV